MAIPAGTRLGPYEVLQLLGAGGMGEVYKAHDPRLARNVALKVLARDRALDKDALARFEREAKTASALNHPHIVNIYEIGEAETTAGAVHYIAMELVEGQTLRERLRSGVRWKSVVEPLAQAADALARAHKAGIVHRDLKPENVMITPDGYPKVLDFGLAKLMESGDSGRVSQSDPTESFDGQTRAGTILGTPGYMSPEQVQGKPLDHRSDIFSFGCILYEAATGRRPFKGDSQVATLHAILHDDPPPVESLNAEAPPELRRIVRRCLAKDPEQRYQAIKDVANDLRDLVRGEVTPSPDATPTMAREMESTGGWRSLRRWLIGGTVAAVVLTGVAISLLRGRLIDGLRPATGAPLQVEKLTNGGNADKSAISPDGRHLVYSSSDGGRLTIWIRNISEETERRLVDGIEVEPGGQRLQFAKDGQAVYYSFVAKGSHELRLYRAPLIGGDARLLRAGDTDDELSPNEKRLAFLRRLERRDRLRLSLVDVDGGGEQDLGEVPGGSPLDWSPDGSRLVFVRGSYESGYTLSTVREDGRDERKVVDVKRRPAGLSWRPDGSSIAVWLYSNARDTQLFELSPATGAMKPIGDKLWHPSGAGWLPDGRGLLVNEFGNALWLVSYPEGKAARIPADTHEYFGLSTTADATKLVSVQSTSRSDILISAEPEKGEFAKILSGTDVRHRFCWTADGKIVYTSNEGGSYDLYVMNSDGSNRQQLTFDRTSDETEPAASADGRYVVFVSDRPGERTLYRINRDGSGSKSLLPPPVPHHDDRDPQITPDSKWVIYRHWEDGPTLWRVSIDGGSPILIKGERPAPTLGSWEAAYGAGASPDGSSLAFLYQEGQGPTSLWEIAVASLDGRIVKRFPYNELPRVFSDSWRVQWSRDGRALYYNLAGKQGTALWRRSLAGGPPAQITHFEGFVYFDWSFDGKSLAWSRRSRLSDVVLISNFR